MKIDYQSELTQKLESYKSEEKESFSPNNYKFGQTLPYQDNSKLSIIADSEGYSTRYTTGDTIKDQYLQYQENQEAKRKSSNSLGLSQDVPDLEEIIDVVFTNTLTKKSIKLKFLVEDINDPVTATYNKVNIPGSSKQFIYYNDTDTSTSKNWVLHLHDDFLSEQGGLLAVVNFFKSLAYPEYQNTTIKTIITHVKIGNMINEIGVVTSVEPQYQYPIRDGIFIYCQLNISFDPIRDKAYSSSEIDKLSQASEFNTADTKAQKSAENQNIDGNTASQSNQNLNNTLKNNLNDKEKAWNTSIENLAKKTPGNADYVDSLNKCSSAKKDYEKAKDEYDAQQTLSYSNPTTTSNYQNLLDKQNTRGITLGQGNTITTGSKNRTPQKGDQKDDGTGAISTYDGRNWRAPMRD